MTEHSEPESVSLGPERPRPRGLGDWQAPADSVVWGSAYRVVDPRRAAVVYGALLILGAGVAISAATLVDVPSAPLETLRVAFLERAMRGIYWTVATVFVLVLMLGATKRCFGFGRGTLIGMVAAVGAAATSVYVTASWPGWSDAVVGTVGTVVVVALATRSRSDESRRLLAMFGYVSLAQVAWRAAQMAFDFAPPLGGEDALVRSAMSAGVAAAVAGVALVWTAGKRAG